MSDIIERLRKGDQWAKPTDCRHDRCNCDIMDEAAAEIAALRSALSEARAEARREALEEAATVAATCHPKSALLRQGIVFAIRALSRQEKQS